MRFLSCCLIKYKRHCLKPVAPTEASDSYSGRDVRYFLVCSVINYFCSVRCFLQCLNYMTPPQCLQGLCFSNVMLIMWRAQTLVFCLWCSTFILWLDLRGWFSRLPPYASVEPAFETWEEHLWIVELCWLTAASCLKGRGNHLWSRKRSSDDTTAH